MSAGSSLRMWLMSIGVHDPALAPCLLLDCRAGLCWHFVDACLDVTDFATVTIFWTKADTLLTRPGHAQLSAF